MADWLDEIEAQADESAPYYLPRLIAEIRRLRLAAPVPLPDAAPSPSWYPMALAPNDRPIVAMSHAGNAYTVTWDDGWWFAKNVGRTLKQDELRCWTDPPGSSSASPAAKEPTNG